MRIAIASSGLGHVARGIETWAVDTAVALSRLGRARGKVRGGEGTALEVTLFAGAPLPHLAPNPQSPIPAEPLTIRILPCWKRSGRLAPGLARWSPGFAWRWGMKNAYGWEQLSFWLRLWPRLMRGRFDILHVQDPAVADWCRRFRRLGLVKTKEILAHGTEEPIEFLRRFEYVQHLAPWHMREPQEAAGDEGRESKRVWRALPNFVDCDIFRPSAWADERTAVRRNLGIPDDALVVGCVAAVKKDHKRIDYLIREAAGCRLQAAGEKPRGSLFLLIAGARTNETPELQRMAETMMPGRHRILVDCSREQMPDLYRAMDVFVLSSLFEMMPIALLEAMASGLPCLVNRHPVLEWMIGAGGDRGSGVEGRGWKGEGADGDPVQKAAENAKARTPPKAAAVGIECSPSPVLAAGIAIDMSQGGALVAALAGLTPEWIAGRGAAARRHAVEVFSTEVVIGKYVVYYRDVVGRSTRTSTPHGASRRDV